MKNFETQSNLWNTYCVRTFPNKYAMMQGIFKFIIGISNGLLFIAIWKCSHRFVLRTRKPGRGSKCWKMNNWLFNLKIQDHELKNTILSSPCNTELRSDIFRISGTGLLDKCPYELIQIKRTSNKRFPQSTKRNLLPRTSLWQIDYSDRRSFSEKIIW